MLLLVPVGVMVICLILGTFRLKELGRSQKYLFFLVLSGLVAEGAARILTKSGPTSYPVFHIYALVEYTLLALIYSELFNKRKSRIYLRISILVVLAFGVVNVSFFQGWHELNTNVTIVISSVLIVLAITFFFRMLNEMRYHRIERSSVFWINNGVIIYFSSSLLLFVFSNWLVELSVNSALSVWLIHLGFNTVHYACFAIALWMKPE